MRQNLFSVFHDLFGKLDDGIFFILDQQFRCLFSHASRNGKDRTFLRLHNRLVRGFHATFKTGNQIDQGKLLLPSDILAESAEQLGKDYARISPGPPKRTTGNGFRKRINRRILLHFYIRSRSHDRKSHICSRISVRDGKYI